MNNSQLKVLVSRLPNQHSFIYLFTYLFILSRQDDFNSQEETTDEPDSCIGLPVAESTVVDEERPPVLQRSVSVLNFNMSS